MIGNDHHLCIEDEGCRASYFIHFNLNLVESLDRLDINCILYSPNLAPKLYPRIHVLPKNRRFIRSG